MLRKCPQSCHLTVLCSVQSAKRMFSGFLRNDWMNQGSKLFHPSERLSYTNVAIPIGNSSFTSSRQ